MRHIPQQERSRQMVKTILEGTLDAIDRHGLENTTTRHIAERAGISVGTLYHYYSDKEAVFSALQKQLVTELITAIRSLGPGLVQVDIATGIRNLVEMYLKELNRDGGKRMSFMRHLAHRDFNEEMQRVEQVIMELLMMMLPRHPEMAQIKNLPKVVYMLFNSLAFNLIRYTENPPPHISEKDLADGFVDLAIAYLSSQMPAEAAAKLTAAKSQ